MASPVAVQCCRCTVRKTDPLFQSLPVSPPSPSGLILPPPVAHSKFRWWRHPVSRSDRATGHRSASGACCRRWAATYPAAGAEGVFADADPVSAVSPPALLPATPVAPCLLYTSDAADDLLCVDL